MDEFLKTYLLDYAPKSSTPKAAPAQPAPKQEREQERAPRGELRSESDAEWFALSKWMKTNGVGSPRQRSLAYGVGRYISNGWPVTPKMRIASTSVWDLALREGWEPWS